jgi:hypothetical protein
MRGSPGDIVLVVGGRQPAVDQGHGHHVLDAVVAIGGIGERTFLVDDADRGLLRAQDDPADVVDPVGDLGMERHRAFDGGLGMELGRKADLEQYVLHDVAAERALEFERPALEQHVVEAPGLGGEDRGIAHLALAHHQRETNRSRGRVSRRPALARARVRTVAVGAEGSARRPTPAIRRR